MNDESKTKKYKMIPYELYGYLTKKDWSMVYMNHEGIVFFERDGNLCHFLNADGTLRKGD